MEGSKDLEFIFSADPFSTRALAYVLFFLMLASGVIITKSYSIPAGLVDETTGPLLEHFGYNNLCFYIDDMPAKYVAIILCMFWFLAWNAFLALQWLDCKMGYMRGHVHSRFMAATSILTTFDVLAACFFPAVFVVHPKDNFVLHTVPFSIFIVSICSIAVRLQCYELHQKWKGSTTTSKVVAWTYVALLVAASLQKLYFQFKGMFVKDPPPVWLGQVNDKVWTFCAAIVPLVKSLWQWSQHRRGLIGGLKIALSPSSDHTYALADP